MKQIPAFALLLVVGATVTAQESNLWTYWTAHDPESSVTLDHSPWDSFLSMYIVLDDRSNVNLVSYARVNSTDHTALMRYVDYLETIQVTSLSKNQQLAYWINLYNALTVQVILDHYPVDSIREIKLSRGLFSTGPWKSPLVEIEGEAVSLDDIEHRILRPIWRDPPIHYALNCASYGCPNLQPIAFTHANAEGLLDQGARDYINHSRGAELRDGRLFLSSIYEWFPEDFDVDGGVTEHLLKYAEPDIADSVRNYTGRIRYEYDWELNQRR